MLGLIPTFFNIIASAGKVGVAFVTVFATASVASRPVCGVDAPAVIALAGILGIGGVGAGGGIPDGPIKVHRHGPARLHGHEVGLLEGVVVLGDEEGVVTWAVRQHPASS